MKALADTIKIIMPFGIRLAADMMMTKVREKEYIQDWWAKKFKELGLNPKEYKQVGVSRKLDNSDVVFKFKRRDAA